ncbi:MAG: glycerate kinase [Clostridia bacterium]|nr:glycerate kinase [Clostridia bacterium]
MSYKDLSGFPLGLNFSVSGDDPQTRRDCWEKALRYAARPEFEGIILFDLYLPPISSEGAQYVCILHTKDIVQGRAVYELLKKYELIHTYLKTESPILQENTLELYFDKSRCLGKIIKGGAIERNELEDNPLPENVAKDELKNRSGKVLIAAQSCGELSAHGAVALMAGEIYEKSEKHLALLPICGGEAGTVETLAGRQRARLVYCKIHNAKMEKIRGRYAVLPNKKVVIDCSDLLTGIEDFDSSSDDGELTSYGAGELIAHALDSGYCDLSIVINETAAPFDGGIGLLSALGFQFFDENSEPTDKLIRARSFNGDKRHLRLSEAKITVLYSSPLRLSQAVIGGNKSPKIAEALNRLTALHPYCAELAGSGCAGGIGYACAAFLQAELKNSANAILDWMKFDELKRNANALILVTNEMDSEVLTGEGAALEALKRAADAKIPAFVMARAFSKQTEDFLLSRRIRLHTLDKDSEAESIEACMSGILSNLNR